MAWSAGAARERDVREANFLSSQRRLPPLERIGYIEERDARGAAFARSAVAPREALDARVIAA